MTTYALNTETVTGMIPAAYGKSSRPVQAYPTNLVPLVYRGGWNTAHTEYVWACGSYRMVLVGQHVVLVVRKGGNWYFRRVCRVNVVNAVKNGLGMDVMGGTAFTAGMLATAFTECNFAQRSAR